MDFDPRRVFLAMVIGLLIGVERERRRSDEAYSAFAGIRTFALVGLLGGLLGRLDSIVLIAVGAASIALLTMVVYVVNRDDQDRGVTTEVAMMVTFTLGVLAQRAPVEAAATGVVVTAVLALRDRLHRAVRETITAVELRDGLLLLVFALVVMPLAPERGVGPYAAIHPAALVRLVVVMMAINALGHVALRYYGARLGLPITGLAGGFVSSSATIASMSLRAKQDPTNYHGPLAAAFASCVATGIQYLAIVASIDASFLRALAPPLLTSAAVAALLAISFTRRASASVASAEQRPFRLMSAIVLVAAFCAVSVLSSALRELLGTAGVMVASALAGLVDAHSTAGSVTAQHLAGQLDTSAALMASLTALSTNNLSKVAFAWSGRHLQFGLWTTAGVFLIGIVPWLTLLVR